MGLLTAKLTNPQSKHIRFTVAQDKRLDDACTYLGCSLQSFISEATLKRLAEVEAEMRADKEHRERSKKETSRRREARGLGLRDRPATEERPAPEPPPPPAPQVIVNVPAATSNQNNTVEALAAFVAKGSILERSSRLDRAREVLAASLDGAALETAKKALDDAVAATVPKSGVLDWFKR